jgi:hypothetical protein
LVFLVLVVARVFQIGKMFYKGGTHWQLLLICKASMVTYYFVL